MGAWEETVSTQKISQQAENLSESHDSEVGREEGMKRGQESIQASDELAADLGAGGQAMSDRGQATGNAYAFILGNADF